MGQEPLGKYKMHPPKDGLHDNFNLRFDPTAKVVGEEFADRIQRVGTEAYNVVHAGVTDPREALVLGTLLARAIGMNVHGPLVVDGYRGIEAHVEGEGQDRVGTSAAFDEFWHGDEMQRLLSELEAALSPETHPGVPTVIKAAIVMTRISERVLPHLYRALAEDAGTELDAVDRG